MLMLLTAFQCHKEPDNDVPACIKQKIAKLKMEPKTNPPARVYEYRDTTTGKKYYLFSAACCDQYDELYDALCHYVCAPSGGITGGGDGKCGTLKQRLVQIRLIWKDER